MMKALSVLLGILAYVGVCNAQAPTWKLDKAHSQVKFSVAHMVISEVSGLFKDFDVTFASAKEDFTDAVIGATIKAGSIDTGSENRDRHLRSDDFLNVEKYPEITFKSAKVEKTGDGTYKIFGDLTIRDVTKPVILDTQYKGTVKDGRGNPVAAFKATTTIDRFEFGTKWDRMIEGTGLVAGKNVEITLLLELKKQ
jgi:polyisoprenoid-binding protein YceI